MQICQKAYEMLRSYHGAFLLESFNSERSVLVPEKCSGSPKRTIIFQTDKGEIRCILVFAVLRGKSVV